MARFHQKTMDLCQKRKPQIFQYCSCSFEKFSSEYISIDAYLVRGCLHDTEATFAPAVDHSGFPTTTKCHAGASHPGVSSPRLLYRGDNFTPVQNLATVSCKL